MTMTAPATTMTPDYKVKDISLAEFGPAPDRLELIRTVVQRAQAAAGTSALIAVASEAFDLDAVQGCAIRPDRVFLLGLDEAGAIAVALSPRNDAETKERVEDTLAMLSAAGSVTLAQEDVSVAARSAS